MIIFTENIKGVPEGTRSAEKDLRSLKARWIIPLVLRSFQSESQLCIRMMLREKRTGDNWANENCIETESRATIKCAN